MSGSEEHGTLPPGRVQEVSDGVHAFVQPDGSWWVNNTGFVVGTGGVVAVDASSTERRTRAFREAIAEVTAAPVRTLVNTHHHGDHTYGNYLFPEATVVGHERTREEVLASGFLGNLGIWDAVDWGAIEVHPPFLTYQTGVTLWSDDVRCEVRYAGGPAHTTNDSFVWLPERSVLFAGDLVFSGGTPFVLMGSVDGAVEALETVVAPLAPATVVPGHGDVRGPEVVDEVLDYLRFVQDLARDGMAAGLSPLDAARDADLGRFAELSDPERLVGNLHRAYAEAAGAERGAPIDVITALADMMTFNGGRPLRCRA
jgi:cyclase